MNEKYFESSHALKLLADMETLGRDFEMFHNVKSYGEFRVLVGGLKKSLNVVCVIAEYYDKWLTLSTDYFSHNYEEIGLNIAFEYSCSFSTNNIIFVCHSDNYAISMNGKTCTLDEAIDIVTKIAYPLEQKDSACC